ncbi:MAG: RimK family alpha-L-glutamate ligase [Planctomycetota bacterium]|nr:MAG: RimK family alpha-L-glutamate ligase [Planctomycetota bacterium]REK28079.1 MAG: RimK family alpha-L-glutamate ligase [Planctomycetota bacterium]
MKIAVLGNAGSWYVADLQRAAESRGDFCRRIGYDSITAAVGTEASQTVTAALPEDAPNHASSPPGESTAERLSLNEFDAVIVRTMPPASLEQVVFRMDCLMTLQRSGVTILNPPKAVECAVDKYLCTSRLAYAGLPVPRTIVCEDSEAALDAYDRLGRDVVVKPIFGAEGRGILRVSDPDLALRTFRTLERIQAVIYLQEFIPHEGFDVRVLVLDGGIVGAIRRHNDADFRTNIARRSTAVAHALTDREAELAIRSAAASGARFAGIDLLYRRDGWCAVIEVNAVPGWRAFAAVTGIDVAARILDALHGDRGPQNE